MAAGIGAGILALIEFHASIFFRARPWVFVAGMLLAISPYVAVGLSNPVRRQEFITTYTQDEDQPLSAIPGLELSRYSGSSACPTADTARRSAFRTALHVAVALLAAVYLLFLYDRELLGKLAPVVVLHGLVGLSAIRNTALYGASFALLRAPAGRGGRNLVAAAARVEERCGDRRNAAAGGRGRNQFRAVIPLSEGRLCRARKTTGGRDRAQQRSLWSAHGPIIRATHGTDRLCHTPSGMARAT